MKEVVENHVRPILAEKGFAGMFKNGGVDHARLKRFIDVVQRKTDCQKNHTDAVSQTARGTIKKVRS